MRKTIVLIVIAAALMAGCTKEGSSGVQDGTKWQQDAAVMTIAAQSAQGGKR